MAGAIPLVRALRESLTGERIHRVMGIVNGTTNFILTKMSEQGADYADVLARGPGSRPGRARPHRRRGGLRRRGQGGHPGRCGLRVRRWGGRRHPRGDHGESGPSTSSSAERLGYVGQAAGHRRAGWGRRLVGAGPPGSRAQVASPGRGPGRLQRRVHRGRGGRGADALRPGGRRASDGQRRGRRPDRRGPQPLGRHYRAHPRPPAGRGCCRSRSSGRSTTSAST